MNSYSSLKLAINSYVAQLSQQHQHNLSINEILNDLGNDLINLVANINQKNDQLAAPKESQALDPTLVQQPSEAQKHTELQITTEVQNTTEIQKLTGSPEPTDAANHPVKQTFDELKQNLIESLQAALANLNEEVCATNSNEFNNTEPNNITLNSITTKNTSTNNTSATNSVPSDLATQNNSSINNTSANELIRASSFLDTGLVLAMTEDGLIGVNNTLPWSLPNDLKRFRQLTKDGIIVMGANTFTSFSVGSDDENQVITLPGRLNMVVSRTINALLTSTSTEIATTLSSSSSSTTNPTSSSIATETTQSSSYNPELLANIKQAYANNLLLTFTSSYHESQILALILAFVSDYVEELAQLLELSNLVASNDDLNLWIGNEDATTNVVTSIREISKVGEVDEADGADGADGVSKISVVSEKSDANVVREAREASSKNTTHLLALIHYTYLLKQQQPKLNLHKFRLIGGKSLINTALFPSIYHPVTATEPFIPIKAPVFYTDLNLSYNKIIVGEIKYAFDRVTQLVRFRDLLILNDEAIGKLYADKLYGDAVQQPEPLLFPIEHLYLTFVSIDNKLLRSFIAKKLHLTKQPVLPPSFLDPYKVKRLGDALQIEPLSKQSPEEQYRKHLEQLLERLEQERLQAQQKQQAKQPKSKNKANGPQLNYTYLSPIKLTDYEYINSEDFFGDQKEKVSCSLVTYRLRNK